MADLRDYQVAALDAVRAAVREGYRRVVLQAPTGAGKTRLAAEIANGAQGKSKRVIFTVPAISLVDQTVQAFYQEGIVDVGVIQASHQMTDWSKPIQIASIQTLSRKATLPPADVVIIDEVHKQFKFVNEWLAREDWASVPFIGLSATPWAKGMGKHWQRLIIGTTTDKLINEGYLSKFRVFAPSHPDLSGVHTVAGDYHEGELADVMNQAPLTADIINTWMEKAEGRPTICFAVDRLHAKALQERFIGNGVPAGYMDCMTDLSDREQIRRQFERGEIKVLCNVDVVGIGVDWPMISCIIYARPTKSEMRFVQNIGRGLRKASGKDDCLILDHSDTTLRLGFVTDIHHDELDDGKPKDAAKKKPPLPKECKKCAYLKPIGALVCPNCGFKPEPVSKIEAVDGELVEMSGRHRATMDDKEQFYSELLAIQRDRGYADGWSAHKYRAKFGVWPNGLKGTPPADFVSAKTAGWVKYQNIKWAKAKEKNTQHETRT